MKREIYTEEHVKGTDVVTETSMAKYFFTEECKKIVDQCLQFFGGSTEIMKEIIGQNLGMQEGRPWRIRRSYSKRSRAGSDCLRSIVPTG